MVTVLAQVMSKAMQQQGKSPLDFVARFADTLLKGMEKSKSTKRKGGQRPGATKEVLD